MSSGLHYTVRRVTVIFCSHSHLSSSYAMFTFTHRFSMLFLLSLAATPAFAQEQSAGATEAAKPAISTKLEAFSARTGVVLIRGFSTLGKVNGTGQVVVDVKEFRDASNPKVAQYGIQFTVQELSRSERSNISYVDEDEIDSLVRGLEYITKLDRSVTPFADFEAQYRTKGDLSITAFSDSRGEIKLAMTSGRVGKTISYMPLSAAENIKSLLLDGKAKIASAKTAAR